MKNIFLIIALISISAFGQVQPFNYGGEFKGEVIVPTATLSTQAVNKGQMDSAISANNLQQVLTNGNITNVNYVVNKVEPASVSLGGSDIDRLFEIKDISNSNEFLKIGTGWGYVNEDARSGYLSLSGINGSALGAYLASNYLIFGDFSDAYIADYQFNNNQTLYTRQGIYIDGSEFSGKKASFDTEGIKYEKLETGIGSLTIDFPEDMTGDKTQVFQDKSGTIALTSDVIDILKALPTYNASAAQVLGHDASGNIQWQAP